MPARLNAHPEKNTQLSCRVAIYGDLFIPVCLFKIRIRFQWLWRHIDVAVPAGH